MIMWTLAVRNLMFERGVNLRPHTHLDRATIGSYSYCARHATVLSSTIGRYCSIGYKSEIGVAWHDVTKVTAP